MTQNMNDLKRQIVEKNMVLDSIGRNDNYCKDEVRMIKAELDKLLYQYYKCIRCC